MTITELRQDMPSGVYEAMWQMFKDGPIWDGNLIDKTSRKWLVDNELAAKVAGYNFLTKQGVEMAVSLDMGRRKDKVPQ